MSTIEFITNNLFLFILLLAIVAFLFMGYPRDENIKTEEGQFKLYVWMLGFGIVLVLLLILVLRSLESPEYKIQEIISSPTLVLFLFMFSVVILNSWLKNRDQLNQFRDTQQQYNEGLLLSAQQLLFKQDDHLANLSGLKQLIALRHKNLEDDAFIKHIDLITSSGFKLENAQLQGVDLQMAKFNHANLSGADLQKTKLIKADLDCADLQGAKLNYANLRSADLQGAKLIKADLDCADLQEAKLNYADLSGADLQKAKLNYADLSGADLQKTKLNHADLRNANLIDANFLETQLVETQFSNAIYNDRTQFPINFNPEDYGMKYLSGE